MPVIAFANPKGGPARPQLPYSLPPSLVSGGAKVTIIDADPERWISQVSQLPGKTGDHHDHQHDVTRRLCSRHDRGRS